MALTGDLLNIKDLSDWLKEHPEHQVLFKDNNDSQSILGMPIVNGQKNVIGVLIYVHVRINIKTKNSPLARVIYVCFVSNIGEWSTFYKL